MRRSVGNILMNVNMPLKIFYTVVLLIIFVKNLIYTDLERRRERNSLMNTPTTILKSYDVIPPPFE